MSELTSQVPVGFRFHPTDEELVGYYLPKKVNAKEIDLDLIRELDLYKLEPWDLHELCKIQTSTVTVAVESSVTPTDCYFFSHKDKKYPTGNRANRATSKGFWKATGRDKPISSKANSRLIGMRKTLVFYQGRAPHGIKTDWIMHEFRLDDGPARPPQDDGGWVVCRVFQKNKNLKLKLEERSVSFEEPQLGIPTEPLSSPEIFSGGRYAFPDHAHYNPAVKEEIMNLDDYQRHLHYGEYPLPTAPGHSMLPSSSTPTTYAPFALSSRKPPQELEYLSMPEGYQGEREFYYNATTSGSDGDGDDAATHGADNLDWRALLHLESPNTDADGNDAMEYAGASTSTGKLSADSDMAFPTHLKRQNADIFSSMELWNYNPVAQYL